MAKKGPRAKITDVLGQADLDGQARTALSKSGKGLRAKSEKATREADRAEMAAYKLNRRARF